MIFQFREASDIFGNWSLSKHHISRTPSKCRKTRRRSSFWLVIVLIVINGTWNGKHLIRETICIVSLGNCVSSFFLQCFRYDSAIFSHWIVHHFTCGQTTSCRGIYIDYWLLNFQLCSRLPLSFFVSPVLPSSWGCLHLIIAAACRKLNTLVQQPQYNDQICSNSRNS